MENNAVNMEMVEILIPISFFATILLAIYFILRARTKERLALIEKGIDINILVPNKPKVSPLKNGLLLVGIGLGLCLGFLPNALCELEKRNAFVAYAAPALLFGGIGLVLYYVIESKKNKEEK